MTQFEKLLRDLAKHNIKFVLVGGLAASAHGSSYITKDLDICYERSPGNIKNLTAYLRSIHAKLRGPFEEGLPFVLDEKTFSFGINFTFKTDLGDLDLLGEMSGVGNYAEALKLSEPIEIFGHRADILSIEGLLRAKKAAGRPKDLAHIKELEAIREVMAKKTY